MNNRPLNDEQLHQLMEAVRPGSDDLAEPEMAELLARLAVDDELGDAFLGLKQFDSRMQEAVADVSVPEGLADRLKHVLAREASRPSSVAISASSDAPLGEAAETDLPTASSSLSSGPAGRAARRRPRGRRRLLTAIGGLVAAASVALVTVWLGSGGLAPITEEALIEAARARFLAHPGETAEVDRPSAGRATAEQSQLAQDYPPSQAVARVRGLAPREAGEILGRRAVAYDLGASHRRGRAAPQATLYVLRGQTADPLAIRPPLRPPASSGGITLAAWRQGDLVYVLAVRGGTNAYRRLIAPPSGPLT